MEQEVIKLHNADESHIEVDGVLYHLEADEPLVIVSIECSNGFKRIGVITVEANSTYNITPINNRNQNIGNFAGLSEAIRALSARFLSNEH